MIPRLAVAAIVAASPGSLRTEDQGSAPIHISWREGPEYPMGIQDSALAVLGAKIISAGGFTRHPKDIVQRWPDTFGGAKDGFTNVVFLFDPDHPDKGWTRIADLPGAPRQAATAITVTDAMYVIGGFSYTEPFSYRSTYRLHNENGRWVWSDVDADLPWPLCEAAAGVIGSNIYLVGGADFFPFDGKNSEFSSTKGRNGDPVGRALLVLDTANLKAGWQRLPNMPGVPRFDLAAGALAGKIYSLGGVYRDGTNRTRGYDNVVDSWVFDPKTTRWSRLPDLPAGANRRAVAYRDRYFLLLANFTYEYTQNLEGTRTDVYTDAEKRMKFAEHFETTVLVFDARTNRVTTTNPLLDTTSLPMAAIFGDSVYTLGGEGGRRLWHPATFQIGRIEIRR